jgi:sigma-54 specific flagellar transcriptional regulator A
LANLIERLVILFPYDIVDVQDLPEKFRGASSPPALLNADRMSESAPGGESPAAIQGKLPQDGFDLKEYLGNLEYSYIKQALEQSNGVVAHAAMRLKMRRTTLVEKMRKYGLQRVDEPSGI